MHTKVKSSLLALLFVLSLASFLYINFCPSAQIADVSNFYEMLNTDPADFNSMVPEFEVLEWIIKKVTPIIR